MFFGAGARFASPSSSQGSTREPEFDSNFSPSEVSSRAPVAKQNKDHYGDQDMDKKYGSTANPSPKKGKKGKGKANQPTARRNISLGKPPR